MPNNLRHDFDYATPEEQAIHLAYSREDIAVDLEGYATEQWVLSKKYLTKKDLPETGSPPVAPINPEHSHDEFAPINHSHDEYALAGHEHPDYAGDISALQEGFDEAVLAAQEGAENIQVELQSYSKKTHTHNYLPLSGGNLSGTLNAKLLKSTRDTGYAVEIKPGDTTKAFIHSDGHASFKKSVEVDGKKVSLEDHTHGTSEHNHDTKYVKGNYTITKYNGCFYIQ